MWRPTGNLSRVASEGRRGLGRSARTAVSIHGDVDPGRGYDVDGWVQRRVGGRRELDGSGWGDRDQASRSIRVVPAGEVVGRYGSGSGADRARVLHVGK